MRRLGRSMVALTAIIAIALSSAVGATLVWLWRHPPRLAVERTSDGLIWRGGGVTAELWTTGGAFEQLVVWRSAPIEPFACTETP